MNTYKTLKKLTDQGAKDLKNAPNRVEAAFKMVEKMGGKVVGFYATMGEYDYISIGESPSDMDVTTFNLGLSSLGNVRTITMRAFTLPELLVVLKQDVPVRI
jgi:uncharacterized protein with GYD domain